MISNSFTILYDLNKQHKKIAKSWGSVSKTIVNHSKSSIRKGNDPALNKLLEQYKLFSTIPSDHDNVFKTIDENVS